MQIRQLFKQISVTKIVLMLALGLSTLFGTEQAFSQNKSCSKAFYSAEKTQQDLQIQKAKKYLRQRGNTFVVNGGKSQFIFESGNGYTTDVLVIDYRFIMPIARVPLMGKVISSFLGSDGRLGILTSNKEFAIVDTETWQVLSIKRVGSAPTSVVGNSNGAFVLKFANGATYETVGAIQ